MDASGEPISGVTIGLTVTETASGGSRPERMTLPPTDGEGLTRHENVRDIANGRVETFELRVHAFGGIGEATHLHVDELTDDPVDVVAAAYGAVEIALLGPHREPWTSPAGTDFQALLTLKIIWSVTAILGFIISLVQGAPAATWLFLILFAAFSVIWIYYKKTL